SSGDSTGDVDLGHQNTAQEGRQNTVCATANHDATIDLDAGGQVDVRCKNKDHSFNHKTLIKGGGARAHGGNANGPTGEIIEVGQQNIAQEGRQNIACGNTNNTEITLTEGGRYKVNCKQVDRSANAHSKTIGGGAKATGGNATADLFQQNTAQEGRQNTHCGNTNNLTLTTTGSSRSTTPCTAIDHSTNIHTEYR
ncbi:hypothetical protein AB0M26_30240, partial [Streptomyces sp. NPDC051776]